MIFKFMNLIDFNVLNLMIMRFNPDMFDFAYILLTKTAAEHLE